MDTISLSDHNYILFKINVPLPVVSQKVPRWNSRKVNSRKLAAVLATMKFDTDVSGLQADECTEILTSNIQNTCKDATPSPSAGSRGNPSTGGPRT